MNDDRVRYTVTIDREIMERLRDIAVAEDRSPASVLRRAVENGLEHEAGGREEVKS
jgi:predicted transcriptional regulator